MTTPVPADLADLLNRFGGALAKLLARVVTLEKRAANTDEVLAAQQAEISLLKSAVDTHERFVEAVRALPGPKMPGGVVN